MRFNDRICGVPVKEYIEELTFQQLKSICIKRSIPPKSIIAGQ